MNAALEHVIAKVILGQIRHYVAIGGASLVTKGLLTQDQANQAIGAVMVIVPLIFSAYDKIQQAKKETKK